MYAWSHNAPSHMLASSRYLGNSSCLLRVTQTLVSLGHTVGPRWSHNQTSKEMKGDQLDNLVYPHWNDATLLWEPGISYVYWKANNLNGSQTSTHWPASQPRRYQQYPHENPCVLPPLQGGYRQLLGFSSWLRSLLPDSMRGRRLCEQGQQRIEARYIVLFSIGNFRTFSDYQTSSRL